jgi:PadR family transcriptional regulator AphA
MALDHILLGLLRESSTGYDLKKMFDSSLAHFWAVEQSQIYTTLARLEKEGLVRSTRQPSDRGPQRRVYSLTPAGHAELRRWLTEGPEIADLRFPYLAQVFMLDEFGDLGEAITFLIKLREEFRHRLAALKSLDKTLRASWPGYPNDVSPDGMFRVMTLRFGFRRIETTLRWIDECLAKTRESQRRLDRINSDEQVRDRPEKEDSR